LDEIELLREQMLYVRREMGLVRAARDKCHAHDKLIIEARERAKLAAKSHIPIFAPAATKRGTSSGLNATRNVVGGGGGDAAEQHKSSYSGRMDPGFVKGVWEKYGRPAPENAMYKPISDAHDLERQQVMAVEREGPWEVPKSGKIVFVVAQNPTMQGWWAELLKIFKALMHEKVAGGAVDFNVVIAGSYPQVWWEGNDDDEEVERTSPKQGTNSEDDEGDNCVIGSPEACDDAYRWLMDREPFGQTGKQPKTQTSIHDDAEGAKLNEAAGEEEVECDAIASIQKASRLAGDGGTIMFFADGEDCGAARDVMRAVREVVVGRRRSTVAREHAQEFNSSLTKEHKELTVAVHEQGQLDLQEKLSHLRPTISVVSFGKNPERVRLLHNLAILGNGGFYQHVTRKLEGAALQSFLGRMANQPNRAPKEGVMSGMPGLFTDGNRTERHYSSCHCPKCDPELASKRALARKPKTPDLGVVAGKSGAGFARFGNGHVSSAAWLETQSVDALKLTIRDILRPVAIKRRPTSYSLGGKKHNETSKVFEETYRTARVFDLEFEEEYDMFIAVPPAKSATWWVDMNQAHIDVYIQRLESVIAVYRSRLHNLTAAIGTSDGSDAAATDGAVEEKEWVQALRKSHTDVALMLDEIEKAKNCLARAERWERDEPSPTDDAELYRGSLKDELGTKPRLTATARLQKAAKQVTANGLDGLGTTTSSVIQTLRDVVGRYGGGNGGGGGGGVNGPAWTMAASKTAYGGTSLPLPPDAGVGPVQRAQRYGARLVLEKSLLEDVVGSCACVCYWLKRQHALDPIACFSRVGLFLPVPPYMMSHH
jgi:hypothetical protein